MDNNIISQTQGQKMKKSKGKRTKGQRNFLIGAAVVIVVAIAIILIVYFSTRKSSAQMLSNIFYLKKEDFVNVSYDKRFQIYPNDFTYIRTKPTLTFNLKYPIKITIDSKIVNDIRPELDIIYFNPDTTISKISYDVKDEIISANTSFTLMFAQRYLSKDALGRVVEKYNMILPKYFDEVKPLVKLIKV
jgi:hypothetical protein